MSHPSSTEIEEFVSGAAAPSTTLMTHLAACDACAELVRDVARVEVALHEVGEATRFCVACGCVATKARCSSCGAALYVRDYRVEKVLASGPLGRVYAAVDGAGVRVAVKELAFVGVASSDALAAFEREAQVLERLTHPGIPRFVDSFSEGRGVEARAYLVQELIEGESLATRLGRQSLTEAEVVEIARQVLEILVYLQSLSPMVFHRDIKPANLIQRPDGSIALVDFGAARDLGSTAGATVVGTFGYMPVEQLAGIVDATTDLHALGATLWHLVTRIEPWRLWADSLLQRRANVSPALRRFLDKLVARDSRRRFSSARAARDAVTRLSGGSNMVNAVRPVMWWAAAAAIAVATVATGGVIAMHTSDFLARYRHGQALVRDVEQVTRMREQYDELARDRRDLEHLADLWVHDDELTRGVNNEDYNEVGKVLAKLVVSKEIDGVVLVDREGHVVASAGTLDAEALSAERDNKNTEFPRSSIRSVGGKSFLVASANVTYFGRNLGELVLARATDVHAQTIFLPGDQAMPLDVVADTPRVRGSLDKQIISNVVRRHMSEVKACYEKDLVKKPEHSSRVVIEFTIGGKGGVLLSVVQESTTNNAIVDQCITEAVRSWEFPKPPGGDPVVVSYPFVFAPTK
jgi:TonB family protein